MKGLVIFAFCIAVVVSLPLDLIEDESGQEYLVVPVHRERRDLTWGANQNGYTLGQKGNLWENGAHKFDGAYTGSKAWDSHGLKPDSFGGRVEYTNKPTKTTAFVGADRTPGYGTDLNAGVKYNFVQDKKLNIDLTGQVSQHQGGPFGNSKPEAGVYLNFNARP
uniref:Uncharacterized protein LOC114340066 isoform X3 n=1 Tax=Diabrotica virgifera virgifera TaxID=50390 RepID=A0A6P7GN26_DIAVI